MDDGIYFGLPMADYLAEKRLSSSGMKYLACSPLAYWYNSPLNPDYDPAPTDAQRMGTAHHTAILEGLEAYEAEFAVKPVKPQGVVTLDTNDELKECAKQLGLKTGGSKREIIARLKEFDPELPIWQDVLDQFEADAKGKTIIPAEVDRKVRLQHKLVSAHPHISKVIGKGIPEVTIFWTDKETGVPLKCRIDYLTPNALVDLKSFTNPLLKPLARCIPEIMVNRGYHIQAALYVAAIPAGATFGPEQCHGTPDGFNGLPDGDGAEAMPFVFVFVGTDVPHVRAKHINTSEIIWTMANDAVRASIRRYAECLEKYGDDIWHDDEPITVLQDTDFPMWVFS